MTPGRKMLRIILDKKQGSDYTKPTCPKFSRKGLQKISKDKEGRRGVLSSWHLKFKRKLWQLICLHKIISWDKNSGGIMSKCFIWSCEQNTL